MLLNRDNGFALPQRFQFPEAGRYAFIFIALFIALIAIYSNSFQGEWHFDDFNNIVDNPAIKIQSISWPEIKKFLPGFHQGGLSSRPLPNLTFALNYATGGLDVFGFHIVNFAVHYLSAVFLFLFIYNTLKLPRLKDEYHSVAYPVALLATFFWAVHPVWVTSVTYIVQRMAALAGMFYILSMYFYLKARTAQKTRSSVIFFICSAAAGVAALLSKENAVMLPACLLLFDLLLIEGASRKNILRCCKIFVLPAALILFLGYIYTGGFSAIFEGYKWRDFTLGQRLLTEPRIILFYLSLLIYPISSRLTLLYDIDISTALFSPWTTIPAIVVIVLMIGLAFYVARKRPLISFCILFFFVNHLIEGTFIPLELIYEHRNYLPAMLLFIPFAQFIIYVIDYFSYKKVIQMIVAMSIAIIILGLGDVTYRRNAIVSSEVLLCLDNIDKYPNLSRPYTNLGKSYMENNIIDEGFQCFQKALALNKFSNINQRAVQEYNMGVYYFKKEQFDIAFSYFEKAYQTIPNYTANAVNMAKIYILRDQPDAAYRLLHPFIGQSPHDYALNDVYSLILLKKNNINEAEFYANKFMRNNAYCKFSYSVLAETSRRKGNIRASILYWELYQEMSPQDISANLALIDLYAQSDDGQNLNRELVKLYFFKGNQPLSSYLEEVDRKKKLFYYFPDKKRIESIACRKLSGC